MGIQVNIAVFTILKTDVFASYCFFVPNCYTVSKVFNIELFFRFFFREVVINPLISILETNLTSK